MARTANALPKTFDENALLDQACESSPGRFWHQCRPYRHAADPKGYAAEQTEQVEDRRLSMSTWEDGSLLLNGVLDPIGGAAVRTALEPLARRSGAHDDRNRERRLADAYSISAIACAAMPAFRPIAPSPSGEVAFTLT